MNKKIIENEIEKAISIVGKCNVTGTRAFTEGISNVSQNYDLEIIDSDIEGIAVTLYDHKNNTRINFTDAFVNKNLIDYKNEGKKNININEVIEAYTTLPEKNKKSVNSITFETGTKEEEESTLLGKSTWIDSEYYETHSIRLPHYLLKDKYRDKYEFTMAHESMHCLDYPKMNKTTHDRIIDIMRNGPGSFDDLKFASKYNNINKQDDKTKFKKSYTIFDKAKKLNLEVFKQTGLNGDEAEAMNSSSAYGYSAGLHEDFAEAGAMVILGHNNIDNPRAVANYGVMSMNYRDWATFHPYQVSALLKELYGENVSPKQVVDMVNG